MKAPRIAIPEPNFANKEYCERSWRNMRARWSMRGSAG